MSMNIMFTPDYSIYKPAFGRNNVNVNSVNGHLNELRRNNFINGIYDNDTFSRSYDYEKNLITNYSHNPKFSNYNAELYDVKKQNHGAYKMAAIVNNLVRNGKDTLIVREVPKIFEGLNIKEVAKSLDTLAYVIRDFQEKEMSINIAGKQVSVDYVGEGCNSRVYKLSDDNGNVVAMKSYLKPEDVNEYSLLGEVAIYQGTKDYNVNDIPTLYLANPVSMKVEDTTKVWGLIEDIDDFKDYDGYKGGWTVVEFITPETPKKEGGIRLSEWLDKKELYHLDASVDNVIGNYITDLGGIGC